MTNTIYFENKPVLLTDDAGEVASFMHQPETIFVDEISTRAIKSLLHEITIPRFARGILLHENFTEMDAAFAGHFKIIQAAGGLITNEAKKILFIFRKGKWDLPKGKNDENENAKDCALREVKEETGLQNVEAGKYICTTKHTYNEFGKYILKETQWFAMTAPSQQQLVPQREEGIDKAEWVDRAGLSEKLQNSYALIGDVLRQSGLEL